MNYQRLPAVMVGAGLVLAAVMVAEAGVAAGTASQFGLIGVVNLLASVPFVAVLVGGGYWLGRSEISPERYRRIAAWTAGSLVFFTAFFLVVAAITEDQVLAQVGIVRWGMAAGAGVGALVGIFEARAIDRAVAAERARVRNEELRRKNDRLEEFASIVSHDLRNPLNVATGYMEILREEYDDEEVDRVITAHDRMEEIIEELLVLARSGQLIDDTERVSLAEAAKQCWSNVETAGATIEVAGTTTVMADRSRLQHLLENLFRNSLEHGSTSPHLGAREDAVEHGSTSSRTESDDGVEHAGPDVTVRVGALPDGFYVADDGPGIPADERETVLESGYSTKEGGTGFGLAIVREIVDAHGWELDVTEAADGGARFEITGVDTEPATAAATESIAVVAEG